MSKIDETFKEIEELLKCSTDPEIKKKAQLLITQFHLLRPMLTDEDLEAVFSHDDVKKAIDTIKSMYLKTCAN